MRNNLEVLVDGERWSGWKSVSATLSLEAVASSFSVVSKSRRPWPLWGGATVKILMNGQLVLTGYVDGATPGLDESGSITTVTGRSRTADLVDCSAMNEPGEWWGATLQDLAAEIARPLGIEVLSAVGQVERFPVFRIQPGETAFEAIERACRMRAVLLTPNAAGDLVLTRPSTVWDGVELREGFNAQVATFEDKVSERFSEIVVRGQSFGGDEKSGIPLCHVEGRAHDLFVRRPRRLLIVAETITSFAVAQTRAEWEVAIRAARGMKVAVTTTDWINNRGYLWLPNTRVQCELPSVRVHGPLLTSAVQLSQDEGGSKVQLDLVREDAYVPQPDLEAETSFEDQALLGQDDDQDEE